MEGGRIAIVERRRRRLFHAAPRLPRLPCVPCVRPWATRLVAVAVAIASTAGAFGVAQAATKGAPRIRLKGRAHLDVHAAREAGGVTLSGIVVDDAARPLAGSGVGVALVLASDRGSPIALAAANPRPCGSAGAAPHVDDARVAGLVADDAGRFCVRLALPVDRYIARIEARGSALVESTALELPVDLALPPVTLRFDGQPAWLSLDDETTSVEVIATVEDDGLAAASAGLALLLSNEAGARLGEAVTDGSGRVRFTFDSAMLGPPGMGELRVVFAGGRAAGPASTVIPIERRTRVDLAAPDATGRLLPAGTPEDGIALRLVATARCAHRGCLAWPGGTIEARSGGTIVGAAPVERGTTRLGIAFAPPNADGAAAAEVPLAFHYISDAPWWQPTTDLVLVQPVRSASPWRKTPLVLAAAFVMAWLALARSPMRRSTARLTARPAPPRPPGERLALLRPAEPAQGWTGHVVDAHDGSAVSFARVAIERRGFERVEVVVHATSDASGRFALPPIDVHPGDDLVADGALHAPLRGPLPPPGELAVALVSRRRALVDALVTWARRRGPPYVAAPDPTPAHVQRAAGANVGVARWARAVERAAYGADVVDRHSQAEVDELAPSQDPRGPP